MTGFRYFLIALFAVNLLYTFITLSHEGFNLFSPFFGALAEMGWQGQFNLDFSSYLLISASWLVWRHEFTPAAWGLGVCGAFGGILFFAPYFVYQSLQAEDNPAKLLMGNRAAR